MSKSFIYDRIVFPLQYPQKDFLAKIKKTLGLSWSDLAVIVGVHPRTMRDWARGKYPMSYRSAIILSQKARILIPIGASKKKWGDHLSEAGKKGGISRLKKYGRVSLDEKKRKERWRNWWESEGKYKSNLVTSKRSIASPPQDKDLAEFMGIMIGDGGITNYFITVSLHSEDDLEYSRFVAELMDTLFSIKPKVYKSKTSKVLDLVIHRKNLVEFCMDMGLPKGDKIKQGIDIPKWIKRNKEFSIACLRGLVDTDGSIFTHKYKSGRKYYSYKKLQFTNKSIPLLNSTFELMKNIGLKPRRATDSVWLDSRRDMNHYMKIVDTHNPKHLNRYQK